jgi:GNAT superfamily N-acetyltransferase
MQHRSAMERELSRGRTEGLADFERAYRRWLAGRIRAQRLIPFLAVDPGGHPYGSGSIWLRESRPHRGDRRLLIPRVHGVYVERGARRRGIATQLVEEMVRWIRQHGYRRAALRTTSRAEAMYVRFGFHHISEMQREWAE